MANQDLRTRIEAEISMALQGLGIPPTTPSLVGTHGALLAVIDRHGAPTALRAIIGSRGDTLTEAEVLKALEIYNLGEGITKVDEGTREP
ncbi:hypothetical protein [Taklimakanibacter deserti]|uniref:hypothetical protein n=1 Tax=Taklimakanibacter deserti TaxID=2267839 RepID=UPI000E65282E